MSYAFDPNRNPFTRKRFSEVYRFELGVHPLERRRLEPHFTIQNPRGYQHDLGAADVFLDNLGMLFKEQAPAGSWPAYEMAVRDLLFNRWGRLPGRVLGGKPWWGQYFNNPKRVANAGGPLGLLRLLLDEDAGARRSDAPEGAPGIAPPWPRESWLPDDGPFGVMPDRRLAPGGVLPEPPYSNFVEQTRLLPPREATPDLPSRAGMTLQDRRIYDQVWRDQGGLGTCAAHAVSTALDVLVRRQYQQLAVPRNVATGLRFSPAWVHCSSGTDRAAGRTVRQVVDAVRHVLPCSEPRLPYPAVPQQAAWAANKGDWNTPDVRSESQALTAALGPLDVIRLKPEEVSRAKAYLAAGWVIVLGTHVTDTFLWSPGLQRDGLPLVPLPGERRVGGHGWVLVGYDHVDGNHFWKYQGRFFALSSWGPKFPVQPLAGPGVFTLPFAMVFNEGMDAYALRFHRPA